ncbi:MAG: radical SAM protein [bacterium]|nr:radical SAM protein [bacterium]
MLKYNSFLKDIEPYKPLQLPATTFLATRGCPNKCTFCTHSGIDGHNYFERSVDNIRKEIEHLIERYGINEILFVDENLTHSKKFTMELTAMLKSFKQLSWYMLAGTAVYSLDKKLLEMMRDSGCYRIRFTVESASKRTLKEMRKPLNIEKANQLVQYTKELGFLVQGQFVIGMPSETIDDIMKTARWAEEVDFDYVTFTIATPIPGTDLYKDALRKGYLNVENLDIFEQYHGKGKFDTPNFTAKQLEGFRKRFWEKINFSSPEKTFRAKRYSDPHLTKRENEHV